MNKLYIIGNLTNDPELRTTTAGKDVCTFNVAVNRPRKNGQDQGADFFRVSAWDILGKNCKQFLAKGRKVAVVGAVSVHVFTSNNGEARANMEVRADDVEFLSPKGDGMTRVNDPDDPFGGM
ncbi:MAG: single-stranded DNA-binding protein [Acidaminococcaceae bacterium]|nr:single-stranded DNA-binding protein [Acidaminococcaceae bacterium]